MPIDFFLRLSLGHVLGDFLLQPYWLVIAKRKGWTGLIIHVGVVTFITSILVWGTITNWWVWMIVLYLGHLFIDQFRTFVFTDNSKGKGLLLLLLDQLAHIIFIAGLAWLATGWIFADLQPLTSSYTPAEYRIMVYLIGLVTVIWIVPILEAEITVAVLSIRGTEINHTVRIDSRDRIFGSTERITATIFILSGYWLFAPLIFLPRLGLMVYKQEAENSRLIAVTKIGMSFATALMVSFLLLNVPPVSLIRMLLS